MADRTKEPILGICPIANDYVTLFESPEPDRLFCYSPGIARLPSGRLIATIDLGGPGVSQLPGELYLRGEGGHSWQGHIFSSDDGGASWDSRGSFPFMHARPFVAGGSVYILGQAGDLCVIRSEDDGLSWCAPARLTVGEAWHQAPANVHYTNGNVYLVMERRARQECKCWNISENAPVLMRGRTEDDLTLRENWTFASEISFCEAVPDKDLDWFGVPFFPAYYPKGESIAGRHCAPAGWLETNVVQFRDPNHLWFDPEGRTLHLWARAHTGSTGLACILKVREQGEKPGTGDMVTSFEKAPSGKTMLYVPCPGGQMKFHILEDPVSGYFWLLSTQATDSMCRSDRLPEGRYNLPNNERRRLQLYFSRNCIDWCFAALVAVGPVEKASRHYASMVIDGEDLQVLSRSGDERALNAHDGNLITFHSIPDFRSLLY